MHKYNNFEKALKNNMLPSDAKSFHDIENALIEKLRGILNVDISLSNSEFYRIDPDTNFGFECSGTDVIVFYHKEHHHFMGMNFETVDEWATSISSFISCLVNHAVRFEYHFQGETHIRTKVFSLENGTELLIDNFGTSLNLFKLFSKKLPRIETTIAIVTIPWTFLLPPKWFS